MSIDPSVLTEAPKVGAVDLADLPEEFKTKVVAATGDTPQYIDFFDVLDSYVYNFPDGAQKVWLKVFTEGDRRRYLSKTNREVRMNAQTREMRLQSTAGEDLHALLETAITGWYVFRAGKELPYNQRNVESALESWPPSLIDKIADKVREINPWLSGEETIEAMEEEYADLATRIEEKKKALGK